MPSYIDMTAIG